MSRVATPSLLRQAPRIWVCRLLFLYQSDWRLLNAQLMQQVDPIHEFEIGRWPAPGTLNWAPPVFDRILELGTDPDMNSFSEPIGDGKFNLFERVALHIPASADWLFNALRPYFDRRRPPPVSYASFLIGRCLQRARLRRLGDTAVCFATGALPTDTRHITDATLHALGQNPEPFHLIFLAALYHERQWHEPNSVAANSIGNAFGDACSQFQKRDEFNASPEAKRASKENHNFFAEIYQTIKRHGHRSLRPRDLSWQAERTTNLIFCEDSSDFEQADLCVSLGVATPLWFYLARLITRFWKGDRPSREESLSALNLLFDQAACDEGRWKKYDHISPAVERASVEAFFSREAALNRDPDYPPKEEIMKFTFGIPPGLCSSVREFEAERH